MDAVKTLPACPVETTLMLIGSKWKVLILRDARDNNEGEELGVTLTDGKYYTFSQLFPDSVLEHYKEVGGAAHLEYVFGNPYTIFGQVFEGLDVVDAIAAAETNENDKPVEDITIESITFENYHAQ